MRFVHPITVTVRRTERDRFGDAGATQDVCVPGCAIVPRESTESSGDYRQDVTTRLRLLAPRDAEIRPSDVVILPDGQRFQVQGEPSRPHSPFSGWRPGMVVDVERVTG